jgi:hypothetical protein
MKLSVCEAKIINTFGDFFSQKFKKVGFFKKKKKFKFQKYFESKIYENGSIYIPN